MNNNNNNNNIELEPISIHEEEEAEPELPAPPENPQLDAALTEASAQDCSAWLEAYVGLMQSTIQLVHHRFAQRDWQYVEPRRDFSQKMKRIALYQRIPAIQEDGREYDESGYTFKVCATLNVRAERLAHVIADQNPHTRMHWDAADMVHVDQLETFDTEQGKIHVVQSVVKFPIPLIANRVALGIQWSGYNAAAKTHKIIFRNTSHRYYRCPADQVPLQGYLGVVVRHVDGKKGTHQCELHMVAYVNPGGSLPQWLVTMYTDKLRRRVLLYEQVALDWNKYYSKTPK